MDDLLKAHVAIFKFAAAIRDNAPTLRASIATMRAGSSALDPLVAEGFEKLAMTVDRFAVESEQEARDLVDLLMSFAERGGEDDRERMQ